MSLEKQYVAVIDAGTQSIRATIIDLKGNICEIERTEIEAYFSDQPGYAEQDPEYLWDKLCETTQRLMKNTSVEISNIKGLSITTQRGTVVNLDESGRPLRPAIIWLDQRKAKHIGWPNGLVKIGLQIINMYQSLVHAKKDGESNWIQQNQPEIWAKTYKYVFLSGFFNFRLVGKFIDSIGNTIGYFPFNYKKQRWAKPWAINSKLFPIEREKLVDLVKPSELLGKITEEASKQTGFPVGLPVIAAAADKSCEVLGSGCISPEIACLSYGTTATIETVNKKYKEVLRFFPPYPSAIPNYFNTEMMIYRGYWMINWFKNEFGHKEVELSKKNGKIPEELFEEMIKDIPPGSKGLTLQPYWSPGLKIPGVEAKGAVIGFGDVHTRAHLYRSILEGLTYALKAGALRTQKRTGVKIEKLRVSGGGSQSKIALQMTADIFDLPVEKPHTYETSALGAAINCVVGLNLYPDFETAINNMCRVGEVYLPKPENRDIYKKLFDKVYKKMYKQLKPLYNNIRDITNYPSQEK
ncbi:MAG: FGGY-family carbohydrate kinase [Bacteroidales bacterium]|jgi:sugar (pentulose or hexulose) kinase|nr:FGGY-family carbohydrate kinase [Bacteroidales bacterium]